MFILLEDSPHPWPYSRLKGTVVCNPDIFFLMEIVVVDIQVTYGVLLSRKWTTTMGGTMQMDLTYASIPNANQELVTFHRAPFMRDFVEDPSDPCNEVMNETFGQLFGNNFLTFEDQLYPEEEGYQEEIIGSKYDPDYFGNEGSNYPCQEQS
jgi:hypothetical protein